MPQLPFPLIEPSPRASAGVLPPDVLLALVEKLPTIVYVYDVEERRSVFQNRPLGELLGYAAEREPGGGSWKHLIHPDDAERFPAHRDRLAELADGENALFEYRMRHADGEWRWLLSRDAPLGRNADGRLRYVIGSTADITEQKRTEAALRAHEEQQELLIAELGHRMKNTLATIQAMAFQSHLAASSPIEFHRSFGSQLRALEAAHGVLTRESWQSASLAHLLRESVAPWMAGDDPERLSLDGPAVRVAPGRALPLSLVFHELATNAAKYGALSTARGRIAVAWRPLPPAEPGGPRGLELDWGEDGGPEVTPPTRRGFGSQLLERAIGELEADLASDYPPTGFTCRLRLPPSATLTFA